VSENNLLASALSYAKNGWQVFPVYWPESDRCGCGKPDCKNQAKHPLTPNGLNDASTDADVIQAWWTKWPKANIGIATGKISGLVVVDNDGPNCAELLRQQNIFLPKTAAAQTGRGLHGYYAHVGDGIIENRVALLTDGLPKDKRSQIDIRGDGGYVVAPPSVHITGRVYQWVILPTQKLTPLPDDLVALIERGRNGSGTTFVGDDWLTDIIDGVGEGQRNDVAARLAGYFLHKNGGDEEATYFALRAWNRLNTPPLSDDELRTVVRSIAARERKKRERETRQSEGYTRLEVLDGAAWADAVKDSLPRDGIPAPIPTLEELHGLVAGDVLVMAGGAGMGKSTHACRIVAEVCIQKKVPTIFFTTELTRNDVARWVGSVLENCSVQGMPERIPERVLNQFRASPIKIVDAGTVRIDDIETITRSALGTRLVIVDHLTRIVTPRKESRTLEVGEVCRRLKALAKDCGLTILELCQLNREGNDNTRPSLKALRDSGEIEQEADAVVFLWTAERILTDRYLRMAFFLAKNRHGAVKEIVVRWDRELKQIEVID
jgi:hypothetical protein